MIIKWLDRNKRKDKYRNLPEDLIKKCSVYYIPCDSIRPNAMRSRCDFGEDKLISLAYSVKRYGIIEPICVRQTDAEDSYDFELVAGERRLRAAKLAGFTVIPCVIMNVEQGISAELSIVENLYSEPLNYFEVAVALQRIAEYRDGSFEELASGLSISQNQLIMKLLLLELDYNERQVLLSKNLSEDIAVSIARIDDKERRRTLIEAICNDNMSDFEIKQMIEKIKKNSVEIDKDTFSKLPRDVTSVLKGLTAKLGLLNRRKKRAEMKVFYEENVVVAQIRIKL